MFTIDVAAHEDYLGIVLSGRATAENAGEIATAVIQAVSAHNAQRVLIDCRPIYGRLTVGETYFHVRQYPVGMRLPLVAVIDRPENESYYTFHETTAENVGIRIRYFTHPEDALEYLRGGGAHRRSLD